MRLIDAENIENFAHEESFGTGDMVKNWIAEMLIPDDIKDEYEEELAELCWKAIECCMNVTKTEPTAYDVDKVIEQMEERKKYLMKEFVLDDKDLSVKKNALARINAIDGMVEIVKAGAEVENGRDISSNEKEKVDCN